MKRRLKQTLTDELQRLQPVTAWQADDGSYRLFGNYHLTQTVDGYQVVKQDFLEIDFASRRAAVTWCIADQHADRNLALRVRQLDSELERVREDIAARQSLTGSRDFVRLVKIKLQPKISRQHQIETELNRCVRLAKRYQRGLANENK